MVEGVVPASRWVFASVLSPLYVLENALKLKLESQCYWKLESVSDFSPHKFNLFRLPLKFFEMSCDEMSCDEMPCDEMTHDEMFVTKCV